MTTDISRDIVIRVLETTSADEWPEWTDELRANCANLINEVESMIDGDIIDYQTGDDTGRRATPADVALALRAGDVGAYKCPVTGSSVYISR